jgi:hypothetical protein
MAVRASPIRAYPTAVAGLSGASAHLQNAAQQCFSSLFISGTQGALIGLQTWGTAGPFTHERASPPKQKETDTMVELKNGLGLCMTCNNEPTCFHRARRGPALFCETFDDYVPATARIDARMPAPSAVAAPPARAAVADETTHTGLCMNCEQRRTCGHPKPAGGVWHCEDYV